MRKCRETNAASKVILKTEGQRRATLHDLKVLPEGAMGVLPHQNKHQGLLPLGWGREQWQWTDAEPKEKEAAQTGSGISLV